MEKDEAVRSAMSGRLCRMRIRSSRRSYHAQLGLTLLVLNDFLCRVSQHAYGPSSTVVGVDITSHPVSSFDRTSQPILSVDRTSHPILSVDDTPLPLVSDAATLVTLVFQ